MRSPDPSEAHPEDALRLRAAVATDRPFLEGLGLSLFAAYGSYDRFLAGWLEEPSVSTWIAEIGSEPAGFAMAAPYEDPDRTGRHVVDLIAIAVRPDVQGRGIGARLFDEVLAFARAAEPQASELWLVVAEGNARAERFFARRGFRRGRGVGVYPGGQRALRMVRPIAADPKGGAGRPEETP